MRKQKVNNWPAQDRPREKMEAKGPAVLSNTELVAVLLNTGTKDHPVMETAAEVLKLADQQIRDLSQIPIERLCTVPGVGKAKAIKLMAAFELSRRYALACDHESDQQGITTTLMAAHIIIPQLRDLMHEECWVIYLNQANRMIFKERISSGGVSGTVIDLRMVLKTAVNKLASGLILVHNHPSGCLQPGVQDKEQTRLLAQAAAIFGIRLLDHLIVAGNKYFSFAEKGMI
ncbi:MAG: DNA repair protein RadC [Bacteroidales bacterium]|nr:DNA repair protein RadC [Bacteroidales bacterium]MCL2738947.1 DNA repair protein RadC [Bacteroidales bacterium]